MGMLYENMLEVVRGLDRAQPLIEFFGCPHGRR